MVNLKAQSNCGYFYPFNMASVLKMSKHNPSSERPVECTLCNNAVYWLL